MDLVKTGAFLKTLRKEQGLSQEQLGERLGVTNKTVSRWETGTYLPPVEMLQQLSGYYGVSINELLTGSRLEETAYRVAAEENLKSALHESSFSLREKIEFFKKKWLREHIAFLLLLGAVYGALLAAAILSGDPVLIGILPLLLIAFHGIRNNRMMAYVEKSVYGEKG